MSYLRVIPRDLFNEANLLKCYGRIYIELEKGCYPGVELIHDDEDELFQVVQDSADGSLFLMNVWLCWHGRRCKLRRPLNSREEWPLYLTTDEDEVLEVFDEHGHFSEAMELFLRGEWDTD